VCLEGRAVEPRPSGARRRPWRASLGCPAHRRFTPPGERALLHSFEEGHEQLVRNAAARGVDLAAMEADGRLCIVADAPEAASLEDHLQRMKATINDVRPDRVAIDSLTALQRIATVNSFREYVLGLTFHIKLNALVGMVTTSVNHFHKRCLE
jgi:circadian clock protein KaiC